MSLTTINHSLAASLAAWPWDENLEHATRRELRAEVCRWKASASRLTSEIIRLRDELAKAKAEHE